MSDLPQLITSLTKSEKTYFKRWIPKTEKDKDYLRLFDLLDKKRDINNNALKDILKLNSKQLSSLKNHLWQTLLSSLRDYYRKHSLYIEIRSKLDRIQVLRLKGQLKSAEQEASNLLSFCTDIQAFSPRYQILEQLEGIYVSSGTSDTNWNWIYDEKQSCLHYLSQIDQMRVIERRLAQLTITHGVSGLILRSKEVSDQLNQIEAELGKLELTDDTPFDLRYRYYQTNAIIGRIRLDHDKELTNFAQVITLHEKFPQITSRYYVDFYTIALHNLINASLLANRLESVPELLEELEQQLADNDEGRLRNFFFLVSNRLIYLRVTGQYEAGLAYWKIVEAQLETNPEFNPIQWSEITLNGAALQFWNGNLKEARKLLNRLLHNRDGIDETLNSTRILSMLIAFETEDIDHLEHLIRSYNRIWEQNKDANQLELIVTKHLWEWCSAPDRYNPEQFLLDIDVCTKAPFERNKLLRFDLKQYIKNKSNNVEH